MRELYRAVSKKPEWLTDTLPFTYKELVEKIDLLIRHGLYPFSAEDSMIDDYAIPDEVKQMKGATDGDEPEEAKPHTLDAVDRGYLQTVLRDQSLSLYLQQTIQDYSGISKPRTGKTNQGAGHGSSKRLLPVDKSRTERFIDHINANILPFIDYKELDRSCRSEEKAYAKGILNLLHTAMAEQYGSAALAPEYHIMEDNCVVVPGVIQGKKSGEIALALLGLDLASSGEHCQTDILCRYGVASQENDSLSPYVKAEISVDFIPYDYGYTAQIPGDIRVQRNRLPEGIRDMLDTFQNHTVELARPVAAELEAADEESGMER